MKISLFRRAMAVMILIAAAGCNNEESFPEVKPFVKTDPVVLSENNTGIFLSGNFVLQGSYQSIQYGFQLSTEGSFQKPIVIEAGSDTKPGRFEKKIQPSLKPDFTYYVRTWAMSGKYKVYGNVIEFRTQPSRLGEPDPLIEKVTPDKVLWGDTITITGKYFDYFATDSLVAINGVIAKARINQDTIWAVVPNCPADQNKLNLSLHINNKGTPTLYTIDLIPPVITMISKNDGQYPDTIVITGEHLSAYRTSIQVDDQETDVFNVSKNSLSFIVPYLVNDKLTKIDLIRSTVHYPVMTNFHYHSQSIENCSKTSAWIEDTLRFYAKNLDFRKIAVNIKNGSFTCSITRKWKDSLAFVLKANPAGSAFNLEVQFGKAITGFPYYNYTTVFQQVITHAPPFVGHPTQAAYVYYADINWPCKGMYWNYSPQGHIIRSLNSSFVVSSYERSNHPWSSGFLEPGDYSVQLYSNDRFSNIEYFTVKAPVLESASPATFNRENELSITGSNFPVYTDYLFTEIATGKMTTIRSSNQSENNHTLQRITPISLIGKGDYQVDIKIGQSLYKLNNPIHFNDYFSYALKLKDQLPNYSSVGCGFAINNKLYIPMTSGMSIIDLSSGNVRYINQGYYNYDHQPVFFNNKVYMLIQKNQGGYPLCSFNETTEEWEEVTKEGLPQGASVSIPGVLNNKLIVVSGGDLYQLEDKWTFVKNLKLNLVFLDFIHSENGKLYFNDLYDGKTAVVSTTDWNTIKTIKMPGQYVNSLHYIFELNGSLYYCGQPRGVGEDDRYSFYKFTASEIYEPLNPRKLLYDSYYHFCPDGKGNVWFVSNGYIYKFNPQ